MADIIIFGSVAIGLAFAFRHIYKSKKSGGGCAGCTACANMDEKKCDISKNKENI